MKDDTVIISVSTVNGAYFFKSDENRKKWSKSKRFLTGESVNNVAMDGKRSLLCIHSDRGSILIKGQRKKLGNYLTRVFT